MNIKTWVQQKLGCFECTICETVVSEDKKFAAIKLFYTKAKRYRYMIVKPCPELYLDDFVSIDPHFCNNPHILARYKDWKPCENAIECYDLGGFIYDCWNKACPDKIFQGN